MKPKIILVMFAILFLASLISAIPDLPHHFQGEVSYEDGSQIDGKTLSAKIGGKTFTDEINKGDYDLIVEHGSDGDLIKFYIDSEKIGSYKFSSYNSTNLDFKTNIKKDNSNNQSSKNGRGKNSNSGSVDSDTDSESDQDLYYGGCEFRKGCYQKKVQNLDSKNNEIHELETISSENKKATSESYQESSFPAGVFLLILLALSIIVVITTIIFTRDLKQ